jgi:hypothetical protein
MVKITMKEIFNSFNIKELYPIAIDRFMSILGFGKGACFGGGVGEYNVDGAGKYNVDGAGEYNVDEVGAYNVDEGCFLEVGISVDRINEYGINEENSGVISFIGDRLKERPQVSALTVVCEDFSIRKSTLEVSGVSLECKAFEHMDKEKVKQVILYIVSLNPDENAEEAVDGQNLTQILYENAWMNALLWAGRATLWREIKKGCEKQHFLLSDSFGPGFYDMSVLETVKIAKILDFNKLSASVNESGILHPPTSVTGIYFAVNDGLALPKLTCEACIGNKSGCWLCGQSDRGC